MIWGGVVGWVLGWGGGGGGGGIVTQKTRSH